MEEAEEGDRDRDDVVDVGPEEVLADLAEGGAGELRRAQHGAQISLHEGDVRGLDRDIGAGLHRDADVGGLERGGVVDPVADERHGAALGAELPDGVDLVGGEQPGPEVVDAEMLGDGGRHGCMIAGEHHGPEAAAAQLEEGFPRVFLHRVGDRERAEQPPAGGHPGGRARVVAEPPLYPGDVLLRDAFLAQQPRAPHDDPLAIDPADDAHPDPGLDAAGPGEGDAAPARFVHDGAGERMLGGVLHRGREPEHARLRVDRARVAPRAGSRLIPPSPGRFVRHEGLDHAGGAAGQGAGLVEDERVRPVQRLDGGPVPDENAAGGSDAGPDHERGGGGESERAGAGDDEHRDRCVEREREAAQLRVHPRDEPRRPACGLREDSGRHEPAHEGRQRDDEDGGHEDGGHPVRELLDRDLARLRLLHETDDVGEEGVLAHARRPHPERAGVVDRRTEDGGPRFLLDRDRLARRERLVDRAPPLKDDAVRRDLLARADDHHVAHRDLMGRDLEFGALPLDAGRRRLEREQGLDRR